MLYVEEKGPGDRFALHVDTILDEKMTIRNLWSEKSWRLKMGEEWISGAWVRCGRDVYSLEDPEKKIRLSPRASEIHIFLGKPVYIEGRMLYLADTDVVQGCCDGWIHDCRSGVFYLIGTDLFYFDGSGRGIFVRESAHNVTVTRLSASKYFIRAAGRTTVFDARL